MATRDELVAVVAERYARSARKDRSRILDEFTAVGGLHRKHAMRLLRMRSEPSGPRRRRRVYDDAVREALILVWEASDRVCGKRLRPLIPILERFQADRNRSHAKMVVPKRPPSTIRRPPVFDHRRGRCFGGVANPIRRIFANVSSPLRTMVNRLAGSPPCCVSAYPMSQRFCRVEG